MMSDIYQINKRQKVDFENERYTMSEDLKMVDFIPVPRNDELEFILDNDKCLDFIQINNVDDSKSFPDRKGNSRQIYK
jgi:hypothetical protein